MGHDRLEVAISEVKKLQSSLKKSHRKQVQRNSEKFHLKAVALSWFKNHRDMLINLLPKDSLEKIDAGYTSLLENGDKNPTRNGIIKTIKELQAKLIDSQKYVLIKPYTSSSRSVVPSFSPLISDNKMQSILEKRWRETELCIRTNANLAATVMMGGLLEGLLLAKVNTYPDKNILYKCKSVPNDPKTGKKIELSKWTLAVYLDVAHEMLWIGKAAKDVGVVLRDYRNYIHPQKEFSHGVEVSNDDARIFWSIVSALAAEIIQPVK